MKKVKLTLRLTDVTDSKHTIKYDFEEHILENDSIRELAISKIRSLKEYGESRLGYKDIDSTIPLSVSLHPNYSKSKGGHSTFGIKYGLNIDESIVVLEGYEPLHHDWTLSEIAQLVRSGYIKGDINHIYISIPMGLGAPGAEVFNFIGFLNDSLALSVIGWRALKSISSLWRYRELRKIIKQWQRKNGIRYPRQIREFLEEKGEWRLSEIKKRLSLNEEWALALLDGLGYEPVKNTWRLTQTKHSIKKRKSWMRNEKKYSKSLEVDK